MLLSFSMLDGEQKLINDAIRGKASAFGSLYDYYQPKIYRFLLIKVSRREEAEDLTHQVFLNAWQSIGTYKNLGFPFSSWLYRIARNLTVDYYRNSKKETSLEEIGEEKLIITEREVQLVEKNLELEKVKSAVHKLKPDYQDVVFMRFVEELSIKETAETMDKSESAVKLIQHRALKELRKILGNK